MKRYIVCGGREYDDWIAVYAALDRLRAKTGVAAIIHGDAPGADTLAGEWARDRGVEEVRYPADWERLGNRAGPIRNQRMLNEARPDGVVALPGGTGTADMVRRARAAGLKVWEPEA